MTARHGTASTMPNGTAVAAEEPWPGMSDIYDHTSAAVDTWLGAKSAHGPAHDRFSTSLVRSSLPSPPVASMYANRRPGRSVTQPELPASILLLNGPEMRIRPVDSRGWTGNPAHSRRAWLTYFTSVRPRLPLLT